MFKLEIDNIRDFVTFVAIIRGENFDLDKIKELTKELNKDAEILIEAEEKQQQGE